MHVSQAAHRAFIAVLLILTALLYGSFLDHPFQYDDGHTIVDHAALRQPGAWRAALTGMSLSSAEIAGGHYRPLTHVSYWATIRIAGMSPRAFHAGNLLLHLLAVWLIIRLVTVLAQDRRVGLTAGALFAVHPALSEAVLYASARAGLLATVFSLAALSAFVRARRRGNEGRSTRWAWSACTVCAVAALLSKETAISLPLLCLSADLVVLRPRLRRWMPYAAFSLALIVYVMLTGLWRHFRMVDGDSIDGYLVTLTHQWSAIGLGIRLFVWPRPLSVEHLLPPWPTPGALLFSALPLGLIMFALFAGRARSAMGRSAAWFAWWVLIAALPTLLWPLNVPFQEHRAYAPNIGLAALAAMGIVRLCATPVRRMVVPIIAGLAVLGSWQIIERGRLWEDPVRLWEQARSVAPTSYRAHAHTGLALAASGRWEEAEGAFLAALAGDPDYPPALVGHGVIAHRRGDYALARERYLRALDVVPDYVPALYNLGLLAHQEGDVMEAERRYRRALVVNPSHRETLMNLRALEAARGAGTGRR